jgi:hypothetical protein
MMFDFKGKVALITGGTAVLTRDRPHTARGRLFDRAQLSP